MAVVASVAINVDSRDAAAKLRQFQQQSTAASRAADQLQQGTTAAGQAAQGAGRQFQTAANGLKYYIDATGRARKENGQFVSTAEAAAAGLKLQARAGDEAGRSMSKLEGIMKQLGLAVGAAGVGRFAAGLTRTAATFEGELRKAAAIEGGGNFNQLRQDVERVAAAAAGTPTQVAALATSLSRAGFTAAETGQSLQGIVRGAEATGLSFEQMGSIVSDSMRSFGIETAKTESVVDILVKTANSSNQTVQDLGESLKYAAPIARSLGVNITDLSATMAILANNGIRGSEAGTALRTGLAKLQLAASASNGELLDLLSGNKQLADSMKALGVSVTDASGKLKPLDDVLINLKRGLEGLGPGVQAEVLQALFGEEAGGKLRAALNSTEEEIRKMFGTIRAGAGAAAETQKEMQGFSYSMEVLGGNVEIVSNAIGDKFIAVLQPMVNGLNAALSEAQKLPKPLRDVAAGAAAVGIAVAGVTLAVKTLIPVVKLLIPLMGSGAIAGLLAAGPWVAAAAGVIALGKALYDTNETFRNFVNNIGGVLASDFSNSVKDMASSAKSSASVIEIAYRDLEAKLRPLAERIRGYFSGAFKSASGDAQNSAVASSNAFGNFFSSLVSQGASAFGQLSSIVSGWWNNLPAPIRGLFGGGAIADIAGAAGYLQGAAKRAASGAGFGETSKFKGARDEAFRRAALITGAPVLPSAPRQPTGGDGKGGKGGKSEAEKAAEKAAREEAQLQSRLRGLQIETQGTLQLALIKGKIAEAEMAGNKELAIRLQGEQRNQQILLDLQRSLEGITDEREKQALLTKAQAELESAGMDTAIEMERRRLELIKEQNDELFKRAGFTPQDKMRGGAGAFDPSLPDLRVSPAEQQMAAYREELAALTKPINMAVTGADAIGNAFGRAFQDIATGAKSTQEALADAFRGIGEAFIQMATQIIAKQLAMIAFQTILKALGGGGSFSFSGAGPAQLPSGGGFAQGFSMPALLPGRANGGPVTSGSPYLVGERGPELFVPGFSGSVISTDATRAALADSLSSALDSQAEDIADAGYATAATRASLRETERLRENRMQIMSQQSASERRYERERIEQMASTPGKLDIKYESQVINNVEYVTRDQAERMAAQSAIRGRELALSSLQNSVKTRKRVGMA